MKRNIPNLSTSLKNQKVLKGPEEKILFAICASLIAGIFFSKALITISSIGLILFSLRLVSWDKLISFISDRKMMPFVLVFLAVFLSGGYSENNEEWMTALRVKLPFLLLPFAVYILPVIKENFVLNLHYWLIFVSTLVGIYVSMNALLNYRAMLELLSKGQAVPTLIEHVKYSMFNAYAAVSGVIILKERTFSDSRKLWLLRIATVFIIILMHLLAVRTGLLILYLSLFLYTGMIVIRQGSIKNIMLLSICVIGVPVIAYWAVPSIQQKISYMQYDWTKYQSGNGADYSDSERIISYKAGWEIWKSNPILGTGYGDVRDEAIQYYVEELNRSDFYKLPHCQFLLTMAGSGLLGLLIFIAGFYTPFLSLEKPGLSKILAGYLYFNFTLSFLVENSLERSISVAFFLVFGLFLIKCSSK